MHPAVLSKFFKCTSTSLFTGSTFLLSHSVNRVGSQLQPEFGYMHPSFLKYATKVKLSTGAGLLVRDGTRYPLSMCICSLVPVLHYLQAVLFCT
jgi:hypothetical protein